jgi:hypothetical protein
MEPDMLGREAAPLAPTPIRKAQTPRERCCASSSSTRPPRPAILDRDLFDAVQAKLDDQLTNYTASRAKSEALLIGTTTIVAIG